MDDVQRLESERRNRNFSSARSAALGHLARNHPQEFARLYKEYKVAMGLETWPVDGAWRKLLDLIAAECRNADPPLLPA